MIRLFMGRLAQAEQGIHRALAHFAEASAEQRLAARAAGQDAGAAGLAQLSWVCWLRGDADAALAHGEAALARAAETGHPHTETYVRYYASTLCALRGDHGAALEHATRCLVLSEQHGFKQWIALSRAVRTSCASMLDTGSGALEAARDDLEEYRAAGYRLGVTVLYVLRCQALLRHRRHDGALEMLVLGLATAERNGERILEAELCRLRAQAILATGAEDAFEQARRWLERALAVARRQGAPALEARAAEELAALQWSAGQSP
jgi:hypothetical protein